MFVSGSTWVFSSDFHNFFDIDGPWYESTNDAMICKNSASTRSEDFLDLFKTQWSKL